MVLSDFLFFDENSTQTTSNEWKISGRADDVMIQVDGDNVDVTVEAMIDIYANYESVAVVSMDDFSTNNKITKAGLFLIPASCIQSIRLTNNGTAGSVRAYGLAKG